MTRAFLGGEERPTPERNVEVLNETADLYRYFGSTEEAGSFYACVARTVQHDLADETDYLHRHDEAISRVARGKQMMVGNGCRRATGMGLRQSLIHSPRGPDQHTSSATGPATSWPAP